MENKYYLDKEGLARYDTLIKDYIWYKKQYNFETEESYTEDFIFSSDSLNFNKDSESISFQGTVDVWVPKLSSYEVSIKFVQLNSEKLPTMLDNKKQITEIDYTKNLEYVIRLFDVDKIELTFDSFVEISSLKIKEILPISKLYNDLHFVTPDNMGEGVSVTPGTKCKISYNENGYVINGEDLSEEDIPNISASKINGKILDDLIQSSDTWNAKQDALVFNSNYNENTNKVATMNDIYKTMSASGYVTESMLDGKEDIVNKIFNWEELEDDDIKYPSAKLVKDSLNAKLNILKFETEYNAESNKVATMSDVNAAVQNINLEVIEIEGSDYISVDTESEDSKTKYTISLSEGLANNITINNKTEIGPNGLEDNTIYHLGTISELDLTNIPSDTSKGISIYFKASGEGCTIACLPTTPWIENSHQECIAESEYELSILEGICEMKKYLV